MKTNIGEEGTEQFTVSTRVDGILVASQLIHDPFVHTTVTHQMGRWDHFKAIFHPPVLKIAVAVDGTEGVSRAIMTLDPVKLQQDTDQILAERKKSREENGVMGYYAETPTT